MKQLVARAKSDPPATDAIHEPKSVLTSSVANSIPYNLRTHSTTT